MHYTFGEYSRDEVFYYWLTRLGSWYRGHEISRRGGFFYTASGLGTLTAGLIQAAATHRLDGVNGLAGWRWMYIICAIITIPVGILGYFLLPGTVDQPNKWILTDKDITISKQRLERSGHSVHGKLKVKHFKRIVSRWRFWIVIVVDVLFWQSSMHTKTGAVLLWLKSLGKYSAARVNELGTIPPALGIFYTLFVGFGSDLLFGPAWGITIASTYNAIGLLILTIWNVSEQSLWFAFTTTWAGNALSSVLHGWINNLLRDSPEERSFTLVLTNAIAQSSTAWTPLLVFETVEAPRYLKGWAYSFGMAVALIIGTWVLDWFLKRDK